MSWRAPDELMRRVKRAAARSGRSMNEYVSAVLDAATNPTLEGDDAARLRARLAQAGLLADEGAPRRRPPRKRVAAARKAATKGKSLSQIVAESR